MYKWFKYSAALASLGILGFVGLFSAYGFSQGFDVLSGLSYFFERARSPVDENPHLEDVAWQRVTWLADIQSRELHESSGLTASNIHKDVLWSLNDSGNEPRIYAMNLQGEHLGSWLIDAENVVDWESMDSFQLNGKFYIAIGDTGDNLRWRPTLSILIVEEPETLEPSDTKLNIAWQVKYSYPDGFRDSEAMAIDVDANLIYLLSKRHYPPEMYALPLQGDSEVLVAEKLAELSHIPRPTQIETERDDNAEYRHMPSGMDLAGSRLAVTTYQHAYLYERSNLSEAPKRIQLPSIGQREALTFAAGRDNAFYVSRERADETGPADIFLVEFSSGKLSD